MEFFDWSNIFIERRIALWEERKNMNPSQNNLKQKSGGEENIITETKTKLTKTECVNTTNPLIRNCPKCDKTLNYKHWEIFRRARKSNSLCNNCSRKNVKEKKWERICPVCNKNVSHTTKYQREYSTNKPCKDCSHIGLKYNVVEIVYSEKDLTRNCPICKKKLFYSNIKTKIRADKENRICQHCVGDIAIKSRKPFSEDTKNKIGIHRKNKTYGELGIVVDLKARGEKISKSKKGKSFTNEHKLELRKSRIHFIKKYGIGGPSFNPDACKYFDELNKQNGWDLQHALNGGEFYLTELGYWLDAYDKERNIVVEYDEPYHYKNENVKLYDYNRMRNIITYLQCKFLRYNEITKELKENKL